MGPQAKHNNFTSSSPSLFYRASQLTHFDDTTNSLTLAQKNENLVAWPIRSIISRWVFFNIFIEQTHIKSNLYILRKYFTKRLSILVSLRGNPEHIQQGTGAIDLLLQ